jgi:hypothetical protein
MYITVQSDENKVTKKVDGETWTEALEEFFYALQGLSFCFAFNPDEMVAMLEDAIAKAIEEKT